MRTVEVRIHPFHSLRDDAGVGHNRWHPYIKPAAYCASGDLIIIETRDAVDGQIGPDAVDASVLSIDLSVVHPLTGPVAVEGAKPGDLLEVEILDIAPSTFGYTIEFPDFGFLRDQFPEPFLVKWNLKDGWATSEQIPCVRIPAAPFIGTIGVAPDRALLERARERENASLARGEFAYPPSDPTGAVPEGIIGLEGLRTGPPRENGGNLDVKEVGMGTRLFLPVFVDGALLSAGDAHFAQGDGEVCGQGIEMRAVLTLRITNHPRRAYREGTTRPYMISASQPASGPRLIKTGLSIADDGANYSENITLAARQALVAMIEHLVNEGFTRQQAYALCSVAVDLKISEIVDVPNVIVSASLPLDIFTHDRRQR